MTTYQKYSVYLTPNQEAKVRDAYKHNKGCSVRIQPKPGNRELMLTISQINQILKAKREGKAVGIKLSKTQLQKSGGFLPLLAALAPAALKGITSGAAAYLGSKGLAKLFRKKVLGFIFRESLKKKFRTPF